MPLYVDGYVAPVPKRKLAAYRWIAHRDRVNRKVMKDPRMAKMTEQEMPVDMRRMAYGGFKVLVDL